MSKDDYIKGATSKIFNPTHKRAVQAELSDHILNAQGFNEEIGYEADAAENLAVEKMGDYEEVAESLGALHNDFYTPIGDIIAFVIWLAGLGGAYYLLNKYIFGDFGAMPITLAAVCLSCAVFFISAGIMLRRNRLPVIIGTFLCGGATAVFMFFCFKDIIEQIYNNINNLYELIVNSDIVTASVLPTNIITVIVTVFSSVAFLLTAISFIYYVKYHINSNTLFDNHIKRFFKGFSFIVSIAFIVFTVFFGYRFFTIQNDLYNEYKNAYQATLTMCRECHTFDELSDYISSGKTGFIDDEKLFVSKKDNELISEYYYTNNLFEFTVEREFETEDDSDFKFLNDYGIVSSNLQADYEYQVVLSLSKTQKSFKNGFDSLSLKKYKISENELDEIKLFDMENHTFDESLEFYLNHMPTALIIYPPKNNDNCGKYNFTFTTGTGKYKYTDVIEIMDYPEYYKKIKDRQLEISEIIKNNPDSSFEEIAILTNTTLVEPNLTFEDYSMAVGVLGSFFDDYKQELLDEYYSLYEFKIADDLYFTLTAKPYEFVSFVSPDVTISLADLTFTSPEKLKYFSTIPLTERVKYSAMNWEPYKKIAVYGKGYFAKNGLVYDYDDMPYFEKDGTRYRFYSIEQDPSDIEGYTKKYYLVNEKSELYQADDCFINAEGYLFIDTYHTLKVQEDGLTYSDANGNTYTKALETSWDENGNILPFDEYLD